ncbi:Mu transposase C-terminal domain-containing protein [Iodobacter fluviatilis]|uniref:Mu transposase-like protein n=1 Tax=Iodobacter fluviatilis TaxID=537 RepID=A0A377SUX6_9NEIS|nr:Mu transposase C-terminal domain-containing protein [Iodobacter fluviatilis]TCU81623.1 Mu transposase-like protein [Iodobacter fluviatilis]STR44777.1 Uncharacterised protein [Iodobacter fluviatilis]
MNTPIRDDSFAFEIGQVFRHGACFAQIVEIYDQSYLLENLRTRDTRPFTLLALLQEYREGQLIPCSLEEAKKALSEGLNPDELSKELNVPVNALSDATRENGLKKIFYIEKLRELGYSSLRPTFLLELDYAKLVTEAKDLTPIKLSTLYSCSLKIEKLGDKRAAFPKFRDRGGIGGHRWSNEAEQQFKELIQDYYKNKQKRIKAKDFESELQIKLRTVDPNNFLNHMPSRSSIERRIKDSFGAFEITLRNKGQAAANKQFRTHYPRDKAIMPLEVVEFDDKDSGCFLFDPITLLPYGRAFITTGIDQFTKVPLGFSISDSHRNVLSAKQAFLEAMLPYKYNDTRFNEIKNKPQYFGLFGVAIFDNAMYNHAKELESFMIQASGKTIFAWSKPRTPTEKSVVEDFNGQMTVDFLCTLPGFRGEKKTKDRLTEGLESAALTTQEFEIAFLKWTYDVYCNNVREGGMTPHQKWQIGMRNITPRLPKQADTALLAATLMEQKKLRPDGIQLRKNLTYQNQKLILLQKKHGDNFQIVYRYNPNCLDKIYVLDPENQKYFEVPSTTPQYTENLTLYQHGLITKLNIERGKQNPSQNELLDGRASLAKIVEQLRYSKKRAERARGKKLGSVGDFQEKNISTPPKEKIEIVSHLEATISVIDEINIETIEDDWAFKF